MGDSRKRESSFLIQGSILAIASIISRIIGLLYRVPLTAIIGDKGNSYYSCAYEIYSMLLLISSYSLPMAVSKLVSAKAAKGDFKNAFRVFKGALLLAVCSGVIAMSVVFFGAEAITRLMKTPLSIFALRILAPALVVMAILGVMRGFFQGLGTMMPSAVSQIIEQIINAIISVWAAYMLASYGKKVGAVLGSGEDYAAAYGAAGGTLGTAMGAVFALLFSIFVFATYSSVYRRRVRQSRTKRTDRYSYIMILLMLTIVPVLLSTTVYNISSVIDQGVYKNIALRQGVESAKMDELWGIFSGKYKVLTNVPISIASAMAASCVPSLAAAHAKRDAKLVRSRINSSIRFIMVIAFPCAVGIGVLASPIMQLLFGDGGKVIENMLRIGAVSIVFYSLSTLSNGLLQGINRMRAPVKNALIALALHVVVLFICMYGFRLGIYSVVIANTFFAFVMCFLNASSLKRYTRYRQEILKTFLIPAISSGIMGVAVYFAYPFLHKFLKVNAVSTLISIVIGGLVYLILLFLLHGLKEEEVLSFPKGRILVRVLKKLHLLR
ncbi:MAG: polysaccharide biosynthesis protein [Lachnospiraceae bacterium]|nr:polysaccharide biosynthesis protein [Lachnospiraceae bacterium]